MGQRFGDREAPRFRGRERYRSSSSPVVGFLDFFPVLQKVGGLLVYRLGKLMRPQSCEPLKSLVICLSLSSACKEFHGLLQMVIVSYRLGLFAGLLVIVADGVGDLREIAESLARG